MSAELRISDSLSLPLDAVTQTFGILAMRGAGKSNAAVVMAEQMYLNELPWVAIDPKGDWWGIRSSGAGHEPGLPVPIFGGHHGDLPLEPTAGNVLAEMIVRDNLTCIVDVSTFDSKAQMARFLTDFAHRLYMLHAKHPQPRHIFCEEADQFIPQMVRTDMAKCVGEWERIVKLGRQPGLGCTLVTQRSASLNKDVLSQVETLFALRTGGTNDRKAILAWVEFHSLGKELVNELPELHNGEAWVFSPEWLHKIERITFRRRSSFDSGATPVVGASRPVATLADIDFGVLSAEMAATIERVKGEDPKALKARIAELERQLAAKVTPRMVTETRTVEVASLTPSLRKALASVRTAIDSALGEGHAEDAVVRRESPRSVVAAPSDLGKCERAILSVLAQFPDGRTRKQVGMLTGYSFTSGGFANALGKLRGGELITRGEPLRITASGAEVLGDAYEPLPEGRALVDFWMHKLGKCEREILAVVLEAYPEPLDRTEVADRTPTRYSATSGGFANALGRLRMLELVTGRGEIVADETLAKAWRA